MENESHIERLESLIGMYENSIMHAPLVNYWKDELKKLKRSKNNERTRKAS